jgi:putative transposase
MEAFDKSNPKRFPKFKKNGQSDSFRYPQGVKLDNNRVYLPKVEWELFRKSRDIAGMVRNVTVSRRGAHWYVSIQTEREIELPVCSATSAVGIDMGIARFATLSDGSYLDPLNSFKKHESALRKAQQSMSHKVKFSQNWKKAKTRVQRLHARIVDMFRQTTAKRKLGLSV